MPVSDLELKFEKKALKAVGFVKGVSQERQPLEEVSYTIPR
jgi:hypothetical protein